MEKPSWVCTLVTQVSLCLALFLAFNMGSLQSKSMYHRRNGGKPHDLYFISVRGGFRPLKQQTHLLKQIEKVAKAYKAKFVVNISELGEDDPLTQNGTWHFSPFIVPWYTTGASKGKEAGYFLKQIKIPYGKTLDIIAIDTESLQDFMLMGPSTGIENTQLHWLTRTLDATNSNWRIVVGFNSLAVCEENKNQTEANKVYEPLHQIFPKFGVNVYLGAQGCTNYARQSSIVYIGNPGPMDNKAYFTSVNGRSVFTKEMIDGFLLHRVSSLEIVGIQCFLLLILDLFQLVVLLMYLCLT
ncbi:hypothetical protein L1049_022628 [Liquidambar formosana]|uniref:Uncharacterized protein n=1 Tax=Liquidambar formosana TaxID=63359 RepID=A0AAP0WP89_LIQFO